jgi:hypothetical protein
MQCSKRPFRVVRIVQCAPPVRAASKRGAFRHAARLTERLSWRLVTSSGAGEIGLTVARADLPVRGWGSSD